MRGQGRVFRPKYGGLESRVWWLDYSVRGKRHRESSETTNKTTAQRILRERIGNREATSGSAVRSHEEQPHTDRQGS